MTSRQHQPVGQHASAARPAMVALTLGDLALAASLFVTPVLLGGRHDVGRFFYVVAAAVAAISLLVYATLTRPTTRLPIWPFALFLAGIGLVLLQLIPLPVAVLARLGPDLTEALPLWGVDAPFGEWRTLSLTPGATRQGLTLLIGHALLLTAWLLRLRDRQDIERTLRWIVYATAAMLVIGVVQIALGDKALLGLYRHPQRDFSSSLQGTFTNRNHFAHFLILGIGPAIWFALRPDSDGFARRAKSVGSGALLRVDGRRLSLLALLTAQVIAIASTQSRGAFAVLLVVVMALGGLLARAGLLRLSQLIACFGIAAALFAALSLYDGDRVTRRLDDLVTGDIEQLDASQARRSIWMANVAALRSSPLVGYGAGSHPEVYPLFIGRAYAREFTHAESSYLQVASESGAVGLTLTALAILGIGFTVVLGTARSTDASTSLLWAAVSVGLIASVVHSVVDFVWYIPGLMGMTLALVACALRLESCCGGNALEDSARTAPRGWNLPLCLATAGAALAVTLAAGPASSAGDWDRFLRRAAGLRGISAQITSSEQPSDDPLLMKTMQRTVAETVDLLIAVIRRDPHNARAHQRLAARLLQLYELRARHASSGMSVDLVRDVAQNGGFVNHAHLLEWLDRALGDGVNLLRAAHRHATLAVRLSPLQGKAYLHLASLSFLDVEPTPATDLVWQAVAVRPTNGAVLYEAGRQLWIAGEIEPGVGLWRRALNLAGSHTPELVAAIAQLFPARVLIDEFQPGLKALDLSLKRYRVHGDEEDLIALCEHVTAEATRAEEAGEAGSLALAYRWVQVSRTLRSLKQAGEAVPHAEQAVSLEPHCFPMRLELARALYEAGEYEKADPHIRWCLARRPDLRYLHDWLREGTRRRTLVDQNRRSRQESYATLAARESEATSNPPAEPSDEPPTARR